MMKREKKIIIPTQEEVEELTGQAASTPGGEPDAPEAGTADAAAAPADSEAGPKDGGSATDDVRTEADEYKDKYLRAKAELANFRRRAENSQAEAVRYGNAELIKALLPTLDDLERVVSAAEAHTDKPEAILDGVKITLDNFRKAIQGFHVKTIEGEGEPFDPAVQEAMMQQPSDDHPDQTVLQVVLKGYRLHDRVLRPAKVIVSKRSEDAAPADGAGEA